MTGKKLFRRGCGCVVLLLVGLGVVLTVGWWRSRSEPESFKKQEALLESRTAEERRQLADRAAERLRVAARAASTDADEERTPPAAPRASSGGAFTPPVSDPNAGHRPPGPEPERGEDSPRQERVAGEPPRGEPRQVTLHLDELNALLQERVARWEAQRRGSPLPVRNPILAIEGDHLVLFVQLLNRGSEMLLGLPVDVTIDDRGGVARLLGVRLGQLPLPGLEALPRLLRSTGDPGMVGLAQEAETAANGYPFDPILEVDPGRPLRIIGLEVDSDDQAVHLTLGSS